MSYKLNRWRDLFAQHPLFRLLRSARTARTLPAIAWTTAGRSGSSKSNCQSSCAAQNSSFNAEVIDDTISGLPSGMR